MRVRARVIVCVHVCVHGPAVGDACERCMLREKSTSLSKKVIPNKSVIQYIT